MKNSHIQWSPYCLSCWSWWSAIFYMELLVLHWVDTCIWYILVILTWTCLSYTWKMAWLSDGLWRQRYRYLLVFFHSNKFLLGCRSFDCLSRSWKKLRLLHSSSLATNFEQPLSSRLSLKEVFIWLTRDLWRINDFNFSLHLISLCYSVGWYSFGHFLMYLTFWSSLLVEISYL